MGSEKELIKRMDFTSNIYLSRNQNCYLKRGLLHLIKRQKTNFKLEKKKVVPQSDEIFENNIDSLTQQSERIETTLKWFFCQSKKLLEDNRYIFSNVMKLKRENTDSLKNIFGYAFSMLDVFDNSSKQSKDLDLRQGISSINFVIPQQNIILSDLSTKITFCNDSNPNNKNIGFRKRSDSGASDILCYLRNLESVEN